MFVRCAMRRMALALGLAVFMAGCGTQHLQGGRMGEGAGAKVAHKVAQGICYALPKTVLEVHFTISVDQVVHPDDWKRPGAEPEYVGAIRVAADVVPVVVPDGDERYVIQGDELARAMMLAT